ncbi:Di-/tripeptide transporter [Phycisphaerae bacterium RAS1]|nr:Di-/tripeptide transporter [Phycisphaerae bacterium RAS1]
MSQAKPGFLDQVRSFPAAFWVANTMEIFERMAWYGFYAVASLYITGPKETGGLGFTSEQRGQIQAIVPFFLYLMPVLTGALADRYGYKRMFIIAYIGMVLFYYALGQFKTFPTFLGAFMMVAVSAAIFKPVVVGTVARVTNEGNSAMGFGIFYMMVNVGGFVGPLVAGVVRGWSWKYVFIACSVWASLNLIIVLVFYKDPTTEAKSGRGRSFKQVLDNAVEVLGNLRFFICVFIVLIALMLANQGRPWFTWWNCILFVPAWIVLNLLWDLALPKGSGNPSHPAAQGRLFFAKRMHCSNWRFALFLLIMSGFWTSFNQIFLTMPEYIRDYTETRPMVQAGEKIFGAIGRPGWIDGLAAIEDTEILTEFDRLVRKSRGVGEIVAADESKPLVEPDPVKAAAAKASAEAARIEAEQERLRMRGRLASDPSLTPDDLKKLDELARQIGGPRGAATLEPLDLVDGARRALAYKVRIQATELGELVKSIPPTIASVQPEALKSAVETINKRLEARGRPTFGGQRGVALGAAIGELITKSGPTPTPEAVSAVCQALSGDDAKIDPPVLALGMRDAAYRPFVWKRFEAGRQVNPEHLVNIDALAIVLLQVLVSFVMGRFHQFTTMIVGMVIAAVGIGLSAVAGGTMIGPLGGSLLVVIAGLVIFAIGEMMASPTSQEYVGRIAPRERVAVYMGYYFIAVALGNLFGGILSGQLYGKLARDMQRPDLMWAAFGGIMFMTAVVFLLYNRFALPRSASGSLTSGST